MGVDKIDVLVEFKNQYDTLKESVKSSVTNTNSDEVQLVISNFDNLINQLANKLLDNKATLHKIANNITLLSESIDYLEKYKHKNEFDVSDGPELLESINKLLSSNEDSLLSDSNNLEFNFTDLTNITEKINSYREEINKLKLNMSKIEEE